MVWIPVQPDGITLRRLPLVTFGVLGLLAGGQALVSLGSQAKLRDALLEVVSYNANRKFLEETPEIQALTNANMHTVLLFPEPAGSEKAQAQSQAQLNAFTEAFNQHWHSTLRYRMSLRPPFRLNLSWFTYVLFCGSFLVGIWNLFFLYVCAPILEDRWGRVFFAGFLLSAILLGALGHRFHAELADLAMSGSGPLIGAVLGAYAVMLDHRRIVIRPLISRLDLEFQAPAWSLILVWFFGVMAFRFMSFGSLKFTQMSMSSILYPFAAGLLTAGAIHLFRLEKVLYKSPFDKLPKDEQFQIRIDRELRTGSPQKAFDLLLKAVELYPDRLDFLQHCWDQANRIGKPGAALHLTQPLLSHYLKMKDWEHAGFILRELDTLQMHPPIAEATLMEWAQQLMQAHQNDLVPLLFFALQRKPPSSADWVNPMMQLLADTNPKAGWQLLQLWQEKERPSPIAKDALDRWGPLLNLDRPEPENSSEPIPIAQLAPITAPAENPFSASVIRKLITTAIQPEALTQSGMVFLLSDGTRKSIACSKIAGLAAAEIVSLSGERIFLLDIHLRDPWEASDHHPCLRISSQYLAHQTSLGQRLAQGGKTFLKLGQWLSKENPRVLPEFDLFQQDALPSFASIQEFEDEVYGLTSSALN